LIAAAFLRYNVHIKNMLIIIRTHNISISIIHIVGGWPPGVYLSAFFQTQAPHIADGLPLIRELDLHPDQRLIGAFSYLLKRLETTVAARHTANK